MNTIELLNYWLKLTNFDENQTSFKIFTNDYNLHKNNKNIIEFFNKWDQDGFIPLLYAKMSFIDLIKSSTFTMYDLLENNVENIDEIRKIYNEFTSNKFQEWECDLVKQFENILSKLGENKLIGQLSSNELLICAKNVLENILELQFDVYKKGGIVKPFEKFSNQILLFETISQCLLTLENLDDAVYLCYISKENSPDGYFGFYVKNNGNLFSINERMDEKYIGQHKCMRNHRYSCDKKYDLFPYDIFEFLGEDYKGYATKHKIDNTKLDFKNLSNSSLMNIIVMMFLLNKKYSNRIIEDDVVYINSLFDVNVRPALELNKCELIPYANNSSLIKAHKNFEINFSKAEFLDGSLCRKFNYSAGKKYDECGHFGNINQDLVESFGQDFDLDNALKNVFETDRTKLLLDSDVGGELKKQSEPFNNEYVGNRRQMELQAFFGARKKLRDHVARKQIESLEKFGGLEKFKEWYHDLLIEKLDFIKNKCVEVYFDRTKGEKTYNHNFVFKSSDCIFKYAKYGNIDNKEFNSWLLLSKKYHNINHIKHPYERFDKIFCKDLDNQKECYHYFHFVPMSYDHLNEIFGIEFPDFCKGYWDKNHSFKPYTGNSILNIVDPVDNLYSILCYDDYGFYFDFCIGFSKSNWNKLIKSKK